MKGKNKGARPAPGLAQIVGRAIGDYSVTRAQARRSRWARSSKNTKSARGYAPMKKHVHELKVVDFSLAV